jgi:hypothetical protein
LSPVKIDEIFKGYGGEARNKNNNNNNNNKGFKCSFEPLIFNIVKF